MPYCPQCLTEYVEGSTQCVDCRVPLLPGAPSQAAPSGEPAEKLVRVRVFTGPTARLDAELARNVLEAEGIPSVLPGEFSANLYLGVGEVQLLVRAEEADRAVEILEDFLENPPFGVVQNE